MPSRLIQPGFQSASTARMAIAMAHRHQAPGRRGVTLKWASTACAPWSR
jgi:hypothetical protein